MKIAVVKYNAGNIYSVDYALKRLGVEATITSDKEVLMSADKVIFPGVGEAETTMSHLRKNRLDEVIKNLKQPVLGICLGMQLMCRHSEEGNADCLGIFDTDVKLFSPTRHEDKVPHMGWNTLAHVRSDPFNKWLKPSCVLVCEDNYSNAHGFPWVYKELKIGKLIGAPVPGTMTAVWWENQIDPSIVFGIPQVGCMDMRGQYAENHQLSPDIEVYNTPEKALAGEDQQLEAAVQEMLKTIGEKK